MLRSILFLVVEGPNAALRRRLKVLSGWGKCAGKDRAIKASMLQCILTLNANQALGDVRPRQVKQVQAVQSCPLNMQVRFKSQA